MPYNLTLDVPSNRDVATRIRQMDEWIDMNPQYVATNIQPDHFPNRMLVGGAFGNDERRFLQSGTNNRNTPAHFYETMHTASAGKLNLGHMLKSGAKAVGSVAKPVAKYSYNKILVPLAKEAKKEGTKQAISLGKELLKEAIKSALMSEEGAGVSGGSSGGSSGGNVYPYATMRSGMSGREVGGTMEMLLPTDDMVGRPMHAPKRGRKPRQTVEGGKFNLGKALKKSSKDVGHFITHDYTDAMVKAGKAVAPVAKAVGVIAGREAIPLVFEAVGAEFGVPPQISGAVGRRVASVALSEKNTGVKGAGRKPRKGGAKPIGASSVKPKGGAKPIGASSVKPKGGAKGGREARALIVKKVMKEKGLKMIEASRYVKAHNLY